MNTISKCFAAMLIGGVMAGVVGVILGLVLTVLSPELVKGMLYTETDSLMRYRADKRGVEAAAERA